jgi:hypothetical protein
MEVLGQIRVARLFSPVVSEQRGWQGPYRGPTPWDIRMH